MEYVELEASYPKPRPKSDGWPSDWNWLRKESHSRARQDRSRIVIRAVRAALRKVSDTERSVVVRFYFDGLSHGHIGAQLGLTRHRVRSVHRRALTSLAQILAPFVRDVFGVGVAREESCPVCTAPWRAIAEDILDEKTPDETWGQISRRIERAVGWRSSTPQILRTHQAHHRTYVAGFSAKSQFNGLFEPLIEEDE